MFLRSFLQTACIGQSASLSVLKYAGKLLKNSSLEWTKIGDDLPPPVNPRRANVLTFQSVDDEDFGHYECEVKEAGKTVLTIYQVLSKHEGIDKIITCTLFSYAFCLL